MLEICKVSSFSIPTVMWKCCQSRFFHHGVQETNPDMELFDVFTVLHSAGWHLAKEGISSLATSYIILLLINFLSSVG